MIEDYQFEKCCEPGCNDEATFITVLSGNIVCFCESHGVFHDLSRGIPVDTVADKTKTYGDYTTSRNKE